MSIGNAVLDEIFKKDFLKNVKKNGDYFISKLSNLKNKYPKIIKEIRGIGLLLGIKISVNQIDFIDKLAQNKLLLVKAGENVVRILPPLNVKRNEIDLAINIIDKVCKTYK